MKPIVIIPARGGSKGVPGKNIKLLAGKPLIQYTIEAALEVFSSDQIIVSTDTTEIKAIAEACGLKVPFLRPDHLSTDTASSHEVLLHALNHASVKDKTFDTVVLLQPTSPFRNSEHILEALKLYETSIDMVVSVKEADANPYYTLFEEDGNGNLQKSKEGNFSRRQDCPKIYEYNGAIYAINSESLKKMPMSTFKTVKKFVMSPTASHDIDTALDWIVAESLMKQQS